MQKSRGTQAKAARRLARQFIATTILVGLTSTFVAAAADTPNAYPAIVAPGPKARAGSPNILLVMTDDVGFGASSSFGGPIPTPNLDRLSAHGLRYNSFHTTAMCSPSRAALLTGRNHHQVGTGVVVDVASSDPGYNSIIPSNAATIGNVFKANGYNTAWFGKNHNTPDWEQVATGPFDRWPTGYGFEYFYGFMGGATDPNHPPLVENTNFVEQPTRSNYSLDRDLIDHAVGWLRAQKEATPDKPFLLYLAPGTAHSPHRAPAEWIARFKGKFDQGWDKVREETFERQKRMGVIPANTKLTPRPASLPSWDSLAPEEKAVAARMMEVYAAQLAYFDDQFGRVMEELKRSGAYDNTAIVFIEGDNGSSGEGGINGAIGESINPEPPNVGAYTYSQLGRFGGPDTFENYPAGWGWAMDTPFQYTKQVASHLGGTRNGMVISWPKGLGDAGGWRTQYTHLVDVAPTLYEISGIRAPAVFGGNRQMPLDGISFAYTFTAPTAPSRRKSQYYEMVGNRAWYEDGWLASTTPARVPWARGKAVSPDSYKWELYNLNEDYSQANDLAATYPKKLDLLKRHFDSYARAHNVYPLNNDLISVADSRLRPYVTNGRSHFTFFPTATRLADQSFPDLKNRGWTIKATLLAPTGGGEGTIIAQGGWFGGFSLSLRSGRPSFAYKKSIYPNDLWMVTANDALSEGSHELEATFVPDGNAYGAGGRLSLRVDGKPVASGSIGATLPFWEFPEGVGIGRDFGTGLTDVDGVPDRYTGSVIKVDVDVSPH